MAHSLVILTTTRGRMAADDKTNQPDIIDQVSRKSFIGTVSIHRYVKLINTNLILFFLDFNLVE